MRRERACPLHIVVKVPLEFVGAACTRVRCGEGCMSAYTRVADHVKASKWRHLNGVHQAPTWCAGVNQNLITQIYLSS